MLDFNKIRLLLNDIQNQANRHNYACNNKPYLLTDLKIIAQKSKKLRDMIESQIDETQ